MNCQHFRLDEDDLPALRDHLGRTRELKAKSEKLSYFRQAQGLQNDEVTLKNLIKSLESSND
jgi:hypothetical protein